MKLALLTLADHAVAADDGRMYMIGGGIDRLTTVSFPAQLPHLSLAVKFLLTPEERHHEHTIQVRLIDPSDRPIMAPMGLLIPALSPTTDEGPAPSSPIETPYQFVYNMRDIRFEVPGTYSFSVELDNRELGPIHLHLEQSTVTSLSLRNQQDTLTNELVRGYQLFAKGNLIEAQKGFERLIELFPRSPDAHNNFAYVLLAMGNPAPALVGFQKAIELGHTQLELVTANIACCRFLLGDVASALESFKSLFRAALRSPQATLFGLGRDSMKAVYLYSQADYLSLMQLNAGRCAERLGHSDEARHFATMADLGLMTFPAESRAIFTTLLEELKRDLAMMPDSKPGR